MANYGLWLLGLGVLFLILGINFVFYLGGVDVEIGGILLIAIGAILMFMEKSK